MMLMKIKHVIPVRSFCEVGERTLSSVPVTCSRKNRQSWMDSTVLSRDQKAVAVLNYLILKVAVAFARGASGRWHSRYPKRENLSFLVHSDSCTGLITFERAPDHLQA